MPTTETSTQEKVYNLTTELLDAKTRKKAVLKDLNEEIKRIQAEIEEIIEQDNDSDSTTQNHN